MSDQTSQYFVSARQKKAQSVEYWAYFWLIFLAALPFALGGVLLSLIGLGGTRRSGGILRRAWTEAGEITTKVFSV